MKTAIKPINIYNKTHTQFGGIAMGAVLMTLHSNLSSLTMTVNVPFFHFIKWQMEEKYSTLLP